MARRHFYPALAILALLGSTGILAQQQPLVGEQPTTVEYLAATDAAFVNGAVLTVDGGRLAQL